jgi:hypothetical protein
MKKEGNLDWLLEVLDFAVRMIRRFEEKDAEGWHGCDDNTEDCYRIRAIKNITHGDYIDAANLCLLAERRKSR